MNNTLISNQELALLVKVIDEKRCLLDPGSDEYHDLSKLSNTFTSLSGDVFQIFKYSPSAEFPSQVNV